VLARLDDEFFNARFGKATPKEREYMATMADLGDGSEMSRGVARISASQPALWHLIELR